MVMKHHGLVHKVPCSVWAPAVPFLEVVENESVHSQCFILNAWHLRVIFID